jgi:hypothetical protein
METIEDLYIELDAVNKMSDDEVCDKYNAESKPEIISLIKEEIRFYENDRIRSMEL